MTLTETLGFEEGCIILSYDGANAPNSIIYRHRFLPALAEIVPSVIPYASYLYAQEPPKLFFPLDGGGLEGIESAQRVQQGCNLGSLLQRRLTQDIKVLQGFEFLNLVFFCNSSVPGAKAVRSSMTLRLFYHRNSPSTWQL